MAPIHAASGVGYGLGFAGNTHRHVPDGWVPAVKFLVEELGADVNARDHNGYTPLHHAASRGDNELIEYLVVPQEDILQASALKELMEPVGLRFAGPALGGFLIAGLDVGAALVVDALTFAASAVAVGFMSPQPGVRQEGASAWEELKEGFAFVRARPWLWATLASAALFLLVSYGPFEVLLPYLIRNDFGGGAATFGAIHVGGGLGGITAALLLSRFGAPRRHVTVDVRRMGASARFSTAGFAIAGAPLAAVRVLLRRLRPEHGRDGHMERAHADARAVGDARPRVEPRLVRQRGLIPSRSR